jgi:hypothetical protein
MWVARLGFLCLTSDEQIVVGNCCMAEALRIERLVHGEPTVGLLLALRRAYGLAAAVAVMWGESPAVVAQYRAMAAGGAPTRRIRDLAPYSADEAEERLRRGMAWTEETVVEHPFVRT